MKEQVNSDMFDLKTNIDEQMEAIVEDFNHEMLSVKSQVANLTQEIEAWASDRSPGIHPSTVAKIKALEEEIAKLKTNSSKQHMPQEDKFALQVVFGGLQGHVSFTDAKAWLDEKLQNFCKVEADEIYCKGDFKGILFAKFRSTDVRNGVVKTFGKAQLQHGDTQTCTQVLGPIRCGFALRRPSGTCGKTSR